ncbi:MAG: hypothetical protein ACI4MC_01245 [Candidatus Coproplasma sp.]
MTYIESMYDTTLNTLRREIEELSERNRLDIETKNAKINAANDKQIPKYTRPISRFFIRTPNRAMAAILDEAAIEANEQHSRQEHANDVDALESARALAELSSSEKLPRDKKGKLLSRRKLNKLRIEYEKLSTLLEDSQLPNGKKLSRRKLKKLRKRYERLSAIFAPPDEESDVEVNEQGEESELTNVANAQSEEQRTVAPEQTEQFADETVADQVEQLPKRKRRRRKPEAEQTESPNEEQSDVEVNEEQSGQLPGQIGFEEINAEDGENKEI